MDDISRSGMVDGSVMDKSEKGEVMYKTGTDSRLVWASPITVTGTPIQIASVAIQEDPTKSRLAAALFAVARIAATMGTWISRKHLPFGF